MPERRVGLPAQTVPCLVTRPGRGREVTDHRQQLLGKAGPPNTFTHSFSPYSSQPVGTREEPLPWVGLRAGS